jgi:hypothetical protein
VHPILKAAIVLTLALFAAQPAAASAQEAQRFGTAEQAADFKRELSLQRLAGPQLSAPTADAADPALNIASDSVRLTLDAFGSFGSSTAGDDAYFHDGSFEAGTVFEYMVHARGIGFLDGDALLLPQNWATVVRDGDAVVSSYALGAFRFDVRSQLTDCDQPHCAWLVQDWSVTNQSDEEARLELTPYLDGDLFFSGDFGNDYGARSGPVLYQFDEGSDPSAPSTYLGLSTNASDALRIVRELGEYSELRRRVKQGGLLVDRIARADHSSADLDGDDVTDVGFDVSFASSHDFGMLAPGAVAQMTVKLQWGLGALDDLDDLPELVADAGPDQHVECEGVEGTVVLLDGGSSEPADDIIAHRWLLDGELVAETAQAELLLLEGEHELVLEVEDLHGRVAADDLLVVVADSTAPRADVGDAVVLWPPNHRMVEIVPPVSLYDACSDEVSFRVTTVVVDEADDVLRGGDGHTEADVQLTEDGRLFLRAERQGGGDGRVYRVICRATDESGNTEAFLFEVQVPHSPQQPAVTSSPESVVRFR